MLALQGYCLLSCKNSQLQKKKTLDWLVLCHVMLKNQNKSKCLRMSTGHINAFNQLNKKKRSKQSALLQKLRSDGTGFLDCNHKKLSFRHPYINIFFSCSSLGFPLYELDKECQIKIYFQKVAMKALADMLEREHHRMHIRLTLRKVLNVWQEESVHNIPLHVWYSSNSLHWNFIFDPIKISAS